MKFYRFCSLFWPLIKQLKKTRVVIYYKRRIIPSVCRLFYFSAGLSGSIDVVPDIFSLVVNRKRRASDNHDMGSIPSKTRLFKHVFRVFTNSIIKKLAGKTRKKFYLEVFFSFLEQKPFKFETFPNSVT